MKKKNFCTPTLETLDERIVPATNHWTDGTGNHLYSDDGNWSLGGPVNYWLVGTFDGRFCNDYCVVDVTTMPTSTLLTNGYSGQLRINAGNTTETGLLTMTGDPTSSILLSNDLTISGNLTWHAGDIASGGVLKNFKVSGSSNIDLTVNNQTLKGYGNFAGSTSFQGGLNLNGNITLSNGSYWTNVATDSITDTSATGTSDMFYVGDGNITTGNWLINADGVTSSFGVPVYVNGSGCGVQVGKSSSVLNITGHFAWTDPFNGGTWGGSGQTPLCLAVDKGSNVNGPFPNQVQVSDGGTLGINGMFVDDSQLCSAYVSGQTAAKINGLAANNYVQMNSDQSELWVGGRFDGTLDTFTFAGATLNFIRGQLDLNAVAYDTYTPGFPSGPHWAAWHISYINVTGNANMASPAADLNTQVSAGTTTCSTFEINTTGDSVVLASSDYFITQSVYANNYHAAQMTATCFGYSTTNFVHIYTGPGNYSAYLSY